jgi:starch synthase
MSVLRVLAVASEFFPLVKTGGLADVVGALPAALATAGVEVTTLLPGYPAVLDGLEVAEPAFALPELFGEPATIRAGRSAGARLLVIDAPHLYGRPGNPYTSATGADWPDNAQRFAALAMVGAMVARGRWPGYQPDAVHAHDWQAGLLPAYLRFGEAEAAPPPTVFTVHNLAFQGQFSAALLPSLGLPWASYTPGGVEYYDSIGFLKAGLQLADRVTTVSPTYAAEIRTPDGGMGLDGVLRARGANVSGIINGIDTDVWNPATDGVIARRFTADRLEDRAANKAALCDRFGLDPEALLFGIVSRLTWQKGMDLMPHAIETIAGLGAGIAILGAGQAELQAVIAGTAERFGMGLLLGYDETLAHLIYAGADALLIPSRFEPCGLTQLCAMRYGCLPVVSRVGGLADTVIDGNEAALAAGVATGFQFDQVDAPALDAALGHVAAIWADQALWRRLQRNAMAADVGWSRSAGRYAALFRSLVSGATA